MCVFDEDIFNINNTKIPLDYRIDLFELGTAPFSSYELNGASNPKNKKNLQASQGFGEINKLN